MKCNVKVNRKNLRNIANRNGWFMIMHFILAALFSECIPLCVVFFALAAFCAYKAIQIEKVLM